MSTFCVLYIFAGRRIFVVIALGSVLQFSSARLLSSAIIIAKTTGCALSRIRMRMRRFVFSHCSLVRPVYAVNCHLVFVPLTSVSSITYYLCTAFVNQLNLNGPCTIYLTDYLHIPGCSVVVYLRRYGLLIGLIVFLNAIAQCSAVHGRTSIFYFWFRTCDASKICRSSR